MKKVMRRTFAVIMVLCLTVPLCVLESSINVFGLKMTDSIWEYGKVGNFEQPRSFKENGEKNYVEGQAIVMYSDQTMGLRATKNGDIGDGMKIDGNKTYRFDDIGIAGKSVKGLTGIQNSFMVSLVKSEQDTTEQLIRKLSKIPGVLRAEPNYRIHLTDVDPYERFQWAIENTGQNAGTPGLDVKADVETPDVEEEKVIALIDTGIDYTHEDLQEVVWNNPYSHNRLEGRYGYNFISEKDTPLDDNGHGTHCSGIMKASALNNLGIRGVDRSKNVKIMALKILDEDGYGYGMEAVGAYNYIYRAQKLGTNVVAINNSWGGAGDEESWILEELINLTGKRGALSICAAGNEGLDNDDYETIPANIDSDYVVSVAAGNENDELAGFSNFGKNTVDIVAPGTDILSTVSYNNFTPDLYGKDSGLMSSYEEFNSLESVSPIHREDGISGRGSSKNISLVLSDEAYFGTEAGSSLKWSIRNAKEGEAYYLDIPYQMPASTTDIYTGLSVKTCGPVGEVTESFFEAEVQSSVLYVFDNPMKNGKVEESSDNFVKGSYIDCGNYWTHISYNTEERIESTRAVTLVVDIEVSGNYDIYVDNLGVSAQDVEPEGFGKYAFKNGTSMATPHVTAAVSTLANVYSQDDTLSRKSRLLGCIRKSNNLKDKVATEGVLDLSKAQSPDMTISNISYKAASGNMEVRGHFLTGASVSVNGEVVETLCNDEGTMLSFDVSSYHNQIISITISKNGKDFTTERFVTEGKAYQREENCFDDSLLDGELVSTGDTLYYVESNGVVNCVNNGNHQNLNIIDSSIQEEEDSEGYNIEMFEEDYGIVQDYDIYGESFIVPANRKLYQLVTLDFGYAKERVLASYSEDDGWRVVTELPEEMYDVKGITLALYNGVPYLLGGFDSEREQYLDCIYRYDEDSDEWTECGIMPERRAYAKAIQTGEELVVTLGVDESNDVPRNLIFKDEVWKVSNADFGAVFYKDTVSYQKGEEDKQLSVVRAQTGLVKDGIVYAGLDTERMGDTLIYSVSKDSYEATGYSLHNTYSGDGAYCATAWGDKFYVVYPGADVPRGYKGFGTQVYTMPVKDGMMHINDVSEDDKVYVEGVGSYLPGDTIVLTAKMSERVPEYKHISGMIVDGQTISADSEGICRYEVVFSQGKSINAQVILSNNEETSTKPKDQTSEWGKNQKTKTASEQIATVKIKKVISKKKSAKKVVITINKVKNAQGYEFGFYATKKKAKSGKSAVVTKTLMKTGTKFTITHKKLKNQKTLFVRVRAIVKAQGIKRYGVWSLVKKIQVKK